LSTQREKKKEKTFEKRERMAPLSSSSLESDLYSTLGISPSATGAEVKKAYIKLAREKHPDVNKSNSAEEFKRIAHAYDILRDVRKRQEYDALRRGGVDADAATTTRRTTTTRKWRQANQTGGGARSDAYEGASWEDSRFTEQELKNRYARFKSESKSRAENSKWWREEKKEAERNKKEFKEKTFQAQARKAGRDAERLKRSGFVARTGYVWQDAVVAGVSVAIVIGAGTYINRKMEQRAREKHHEKYSMTTTTTMTSPPSHSPPLAANVVGDDDSETK
jgi:curved DNA-binding protein CbpA